jgi:hypothetical protein
MTKCGMPAVSFFNLLHNLANFVKASYKRIVVWIEFVGNHLGRVKIKRLKLTGETRLSGKSNAVTAICWRFDDAAASAFINLLTCLSMIHDSETFHAKTKHDVNILLQSNLKIETILTAFT